MTIRGDLDGAIRAAWARPGTVKALARALGVSEETARLRARAMGLPPDGPRRARRARIVELAAAGFGTGLIARELGVQPWCVRQTVREAGHG